MARSGAPNSVGSQFFIVLDDKDGAILSDANTYQIIGNVTSGMETADAIYVASGGVELPKDPVPITTATVANP
jgi:cyclophilin family peptidyl-prolyl cis-trans isomerase